METMYSVESKSRLKKLGQRLKQFRLDRNEAQIRFAARLGISIPTLRKMEKGDPAVTVGLWVEALYVLDRLSDMDTLLDKKESLFDQYERHQINQRQRASKRKTT